MAHMLLVPMGSSGDVNPFIGIGLGLKERGHQVTVITNEHFRDAVERTGLGFARIGTAEDYDRAIGHPDFWDPRKSVRVFFDFTLQSMPETYQRISEHVVPGDTVVAGPPWAVGAQIAAEKFELPLATIFPNPLMLRSAYSPPKTPVLRIPEWIGPTGIRLLYRLLDFKLNRLVARPINEFRGSVGLAPKRRVYGWWRHQSDCIIGLWPEWLYGPQPDWAEQVVITGFVEYDGRPTVGGDSEWTQYVHTNDNKPLVFTYGTAMAQGHDFFTAAADACRVLQRPGLLLTQRAEQLPGNLPAGVEHIHYAPLAELLPQSAALIHHGGIGTAARAIKAGIPQVIVPSSYDQFDNAHRLERLGLAESVPREGLSGAGLATALRTLLESPEMLQRCVDYAKRESANDALQRTCECLDKLIQGRSGSNDVDRQRHAK